MPTIDEKGDDTVERSFPATKDSAAAALGMLEVMMRLLRSIEGMGEVFDSAIRRSQGLADRTMMMIDSITDKHIGGTIAIIEIEQDDDQARTLSHQLN